MRTHGLRQAAGVTVTGATQELSFVSLRLSKILSAGFHNCHLIAVLAMTLNNLIHFMFTWGLPFMVYVALQLYALICLRRFWLILALLPLPVMAYIVYVTADAYRLRSNMWPILLILSSPCAAIFLFVLVIAARREGGKKGQI